MTKLQFSLAVAVIIALVYTAVPLEVFAQLEASDSAKMPVIDPFKVLIKPKKKKQAPRVRRPTVQRRQGPPATPPLVIKVSAIAGEAPDFVAVIKYKGQDYIVETGDEGPEGMFKVRKVYANKLEVYYSKDKTVKTFMF